MSLRASDEDLTYSLRDSDDSQVAQWRFDHLLRLGIDACDAERLAHRRDVVHTVQDLIAAGCPAHTAASIIL